MVPTDELSSLHVEKNVLRGSGSNYQDHHSTFSNSMRDVMQRGAAENEVPKREEKL